MSISGDKKQKAAEEQSQVEDGDPHENEWHFLKGFENVAAEWETSHPVLHQLRQRTDAELDAAKAQAVASYIERQDSGQVPSGFLPLKQAINLLFGLREGELMNASHPAWVLWLEAIRARHTWKVGAKKREDETAPSGEIVYVHMGDFMEWAQSNQTALLDGTELWTPKTLEVEHERLESARNRPGCPLDEQDKAKNRIQWIKALLRRFAAVGLVDQSGDVWQADCIPIPPKTKDDWYHTIIDVVRTLQKVNNRCPKEKEIWASLFNNPPQGEGICIGKNRYGDTALLWGGDTNKYLTRDSFHKRWNRYTKSD